LAGELGPASIGDGSGKAVIAQHCGHIQVFDDEPVVSLDQRVGHLVQEMLAQIGDMVVMTAQAGRSIAAVV
jgi:hypothetical protein